MHIDEYQDTNKVQNKIAIFLTNPKTKNIFVVGDDDQSIYE
ncbi:MAG: UvrD-helicase domain-containing protein [Candidatus Pacebacteria bacterium]|nr:UvrD-helicase domain-containing protein [Candidatus Paceibacterota bacterium]